MRDGKFKLVLLGDATVGKSSIVERLHKNTFDENRDSTIGASFCVLKKNNHWIDIWDTAGQERYLALMSLYYRDADIALLVFDVSQPCTLERINYYIDRMVNENLYNINCIIIGNKTDLVRNSVVVEMQKKIVDLIDKSPIKIKDYIFVSAKNGENLTFLTDKILDFCDPELYNEKEHIEYVNLDNNGSSWYNPCSCSF